MMHDNSEKTVLEKLLDAMYYEPKVFWTLGHDGATLQIFTELNCKQHLFDFDDQWESSTIRYLKEHSIDDILAAKNPDMVPEKVLIVEGSVGIVMVKFRRSQELQDARVDEYFYLNGDLENARMGVIVKGHRSEKYIVGYSLTEEREPYVETHYPNKVKCRMTFTITSSC